MGASAPPRSDTMRPKRRDSSYQRAMLAAGVAVCLPYARAAQDHDGRADAPRTQPLVGLGEFQQKANPLHGIAENELRVRCRQAIGGRQLLQVVIRHCNAPDFTVGNLTDRVQPRCDIKPSALALAM